MQRSTFKLSGLFQALVYLSFGLLVLTGGGWMLARGVAEAWVEEHGWETLPRLLLKIHGGAAMLALLVFGALTPHVRRGWKANMNRLSGGVLVAWSAFLVITGYGLYYAGDEELREWVSRWHAWIGLLVVLLLPLHVIAGRWLVRRLHDQRVQKKHEAHPHAGE